MIGNLEIKVIKKLPWKLIFYFCFVGDILICVPEDKINHLLSYFNSYHPRLNFTTEIENNNSIHFLDITFYKENNSIITNWHCKENRKADISILNPTLQLKIKSMLLIV